MWATFNKGRKETQLLLVGDPSPRSVIPTVLSHGAFLEDQIFIDALRSPLGLLKYTQTIRIAAAATRIARNAAKKRSATTTQAADTMAKITRPSIVCGTMWIDRMTISRFIYCS